MNLANLPPELLDLILGFKGSASSIINLWLCGNSFLTNKLAGSLTQVQLITSEISSLIYPRFISSLRNLRNLSLETLHDEPSDIFVWQEALKLLSKQLQVLKINTQHPHSLFINYGPQDTSSLSQPISTVYARGSSPYIDIGQLFPLLHTLEVDVFQAIGFPALPATLKVLKCNRHMLTPHNNKFFSLLPPSLVSLDAVVHEAELADDWAEAPANLEHISYMGIHPKHYSDDLTWVPRNLKTGNWTCFWIWNALKSSTAPPQLECLQIDHVNLDSFAEKGLIWTSELPRNLTSLNLTWNEKFFGQYVKSLPRTLTELSIYGNQPFGWDEHMDTLHALGEAAFHSHFWPPRLRSLTFSDQPFKPLELQLLPKTLTSLSFCLNQYESPATIDAHHLSPLLRKLSIRNDASMLHVQNNWPPTLTDFDLTGDSYGLTREDFEKLPDSITYLRHKVSFALVNPNESMPWKLPSHLETLSLREWRCDWFSAIPSGLTDLVVDHLGVDSFVADLQDASNLKAGFKKYGKDLPSSLKWLQYCTTDDFEFLSHSTLDNVRRTWDSS